MRLCFVVQRFGAEVTGGAEGHCRSLAKRLARTHDVQVMTTCALDYTTWADHWPPGETTVDGLRVRRFPVARPRDPRAFAFWSDVVFRDHHTPEDELRWIEENGPYSPALVEALAETPADLFVFYSYRYWTTFHGLARVADRAVLVPTAEEDEAVRLPAFVPLFLKPRGILYLTPEEQALVRDVSANEAVPSAVIGGGVDVASGWEQVDLRARFEVPEHYLLYVGRIDRGKGVDRLFDHYLQLASDWPDLPPLLLAGKKHLDIPAHPRIRHLGEVTDVEKFALIDGCDLLLLPSAYESLSIAVLEAWSMARPVLVNGACRVLAGQCLRSNGGLFYEGYAELEPMLRLMLARPGLRAAMGRAGQEYVRREYAWDVVESRTDALLASLRR